VLSRSWLWSHSPDLESEIGLSRLKQSAKQLERLLNRLRGLGLETVHQKAVAVIVVVEDPPQACPVGKLHSRCSSAATVVQLIGVIP
jgi:hypothetical protein